MNRPIQEPAIRRILVALDASPHSMAALEAAAELAAALHAELHGVFVEDLDLLTIADLSFVQEVRTFATTTVHIDRKGVQRQLTAQATRAQRALEEVARRRGVKGAFRVARGRVSRELLAAAGEADLLLMGRAGLGDSSRRKLGKTARSILANATAPVMVLRHGLRLRFPVLVLYDGSPHAEAALHMAVRMAAGRKTWSLKVLVWADTEAARQQQLLAVGERYREVVSDFYLRPLDQRTASALVAVVHEEHAGMLVLSKDSPVLEGAELGRVLASVDVPLMFV